MNNEGIRRIMELQRKYRLIDKKGGDLFNWVLSGNYHRAGLTVSEVFTKIMIHWSPPPCKVLDPTAGMLKMHENLLTYGRDDYHFTFGDIKPQREGVIEMDATHLPTSLYGMFDRVTIDPPYHKDLSAEPNDWVKGYRGDRKFDLTDFIYRMVDQTTLALKPNGAVIFKIGDNHRKEGNKYIFEPWHIVVYEAFTGSKFRLKDLVEGTEHDPSIDDRPNPNAKFTFEGNITFQPYYHPGWAPRRPISMQRHSYFMLFEKVS